MSYDKLIKDNLIHMGTPGNQWLCVPIIGQTEDGMPLFDFTVCKGYQKADTLYPCGTQIDDLCCELCGHPIKTAYWIYNPVMKLTLVVGSECIVNVGNGGLTGIQIKKQAIKEINQSRVVEFSNRFDEVIKQLRDVRISRDMYLEYREISKIIYKLENCKERALNAMLKKHRERIEKFFNDLPGEIERAKREHEKKEIEKKDNIIIVYYQDGEIRIEIRIMGQTPKAMLLENGITASWFPKKWLKIKEIETGKIDYHQGFFKKFSYLQQRIFGKEVK